MASLLIVEDEGIVAQDLRQALTAMGHRVAGWAATGQDAVDQALSLRPDLVLMDVRLKGDVDGITASARIRERLAVPILFLTAFADAETIDRAKEVEPAGYLLKPYSDQELRGAIEIALYKSAMEQRLREAERWNATTLRSMADAVIAVDPECRIRSLNRVAEELTGWSQAQALGQPLETVVRALDAASRAPAETPVRRALREGVVASALRPSALLRRDGTERRVDQSAAPIRDEAGALLGAVLLLRDVTERGRLEERLAISNRLSVMDTLTAGLAHEINNPLSCITANLAFALEELDELAPEVSGAPWAERLAETSRALADARDSAARVARIVRDLKTMVRPSQRDYATLELAPVVAAAVALVEDEVERRAGLVVRLGPAPAVRGSPGQLRQVVMQLLVNAAQAIPEGLPQAHRVEVALSTGAEGDAILEVKDTGCGIPPELMVRIFDPFFTTKPLGFGTGLGLSLCHAIATSHGGDLSVTSVPSKGSTFRVRLPPAAVPPPQPGAAARPQVEAGRILLVDDDPMVADAIRRILVADGHEVLLAANGEEALGRLRAGERFEALICDLSAPRASGMALAERISGEWPGLTRRVVLVSPGPPPRAQAEAARSWGVHVLEKPFSAQQLREFLGRCLQGKETGRI